MRNLAQRRNHVTGDQFKAGLAEIRTEIAALETKLIRWMVGTVLVTAALDVRNPEVPRRVIRGWAAGAAP